MPGRTGLISTEFAWLLRVYNRKSLQWNHGLKMEVPYGTYHVPQMHGSVECECTQSAAPRQEVK